MVKLVSKGKLVSMHRVKHMSIMGGMKVLLSLVEKLMHVKVYLSKYVNTEGARVFV